MAYEYKEKFKSYTHGRISEPAVESGKREREELDEVYNKAKAFDKIIKAPSSLSKEEFADHVDVIVHSYFQGEI